MFQGNKVRLRPVTRADLPLFEQWGHDEYSFFGFRRADLAEQRFAENGFLGPGLGRLMVVTNDGQVAGFVSYHPRHGPSEGAAAYNIGIFIAPEQRGSGYGVEAQSLLADYLFSTYPIARVEAMTDITNTPEQRALEKAHFTREGVLRQSQWRKGAWHDIVVYSKLRGE